MIVDGLRRQEDYESDMDVLSLDQVQLGPFPGILYIVIHFLVVEFQKEIFFFDLRLVFREKIQFFEGFLELQDIFVVGMCAYEVLVEPTQVEANLIEHEIGQRQVVHYKLFRLHHAFQAKINKPALIQQFAKYCFVGFSFVFGNYAQRFEDSAKNFISLC